MLARRGTPYRARLGLAREQRLDVHGDFHQSHRHPRAILRRLHVARSRERRENRVVRLRRRMRQYGTHLRRTFARTIVGMMLRRIAAGGATRGTRDHEAIRGNAVVQGAVRDAVEVGHVLHHASAEPFEIQVRVLRDERVVRPAHVRDPATRELGDLVLLQPPPDAEVPRAPAYGEQMRPVDDFSIAHAGEAEHEAEQFTAPVERARHESADVREDYQHRHRHRVVQPVSPRFALERAARLEVLDRCERADDHVCWHCSPLTAWRVRDANPGRAVRAPASLRCAGHPGSPLLR